MLNLCGIEVAIVEMATGRNFSMSGINSGHHNLPTYEMSLKSDNVEFVGTSLSTHISNFDDIGQC
jgi:5-carboxymethyl-2-hydroxymuconate isomerase